MPAGTILKEDSLDLLADFMGVGDKVASLTSQAMDGSMNLEKVNELPATKVAYHNLNVSGRLLF
jgi:hypothetical protein